MYIDIHVEYWLFLLDLNKMFIFYYIKYLQYWLRFPVKYTDLKEI
jgi:hypothetical protein